MSETFTKGMARNIYFGGSVFFFLIFLALTYHTEQTFPARSNVDQLTDSVIRGKGVWERNNCVGCHTLLGEGAYFAPELGNVFKRRGGDEGFKPFLHAWMKMQPLGGAGASGHAAIQPQRPGGGRHGRVPQMELEDRYQ